METFMAEGGDRAGMIVFDMADPAQIPEIAEPLFMNFDAAVAHRPDHDRRSALIPLPAETSFSRLPDREGPAWPA